MASMTSYESNINKVNESSFDRIFMMGNTAFLLIITVIILLPLIFIVAASFSSAEAVIAGRVTLWPVDFSLLGYETIFEHKKVWNGFANSLFYTFFGTLFNVVMTIIAAYPLSRQDLIGRRVITIAFVFTMLFSGGLIPTYMVVRDLGLLNTRWAMILPTGIGPFNLLIAITFFRTTIPPELIEAARIDGANDFRIFRQHHPAAGPPDYRRAGALLCRQHTLEHLFPSADLPERSGAFPAANRPAGNLDPEFD